MGAVVNIGTSRGIYKIIQSWKEFFDSPDPCYLWEDESCYKPWTANKVATALCHELKRPESNDLALSSLYALAVVLERKDIISILDKYNITTENLNEQMQGMFQEFLFGEQSNPSSDNEIIEATANNTIKRY